ncbi:MAG: twin-arginine translocase subunit TatC [Chitinivibrionales bacterium]|nr:twin-arginine translocase subunit TatC [Chitinivibrionales bacterium]MBD3395671.1 twin-arginine translocase subunit TatC [Chitinivibrionales bacterium]
MATADEGMSFLEHLEELRWRLIKSLIAIVVFAIPCGIFWKRIFDILMLHPLRLAQPRPRLIFTAPAEAILLSIKIAVFGGVVIAAPVVFYQIWRFVAPGLYKHEKAVVVPTVIASTVFFMMGLGFSYLVIPYVIQFLARFGEGLMDAMFRTQEYLGFLIKLMLAFGIVFELPVVSFVLTRLGVITPRFLIDNTRYAVVVIFIVAAVLTPPDVVSQAFLAAPLLVLYGISILVSMAVAGRQHG